MFRDLRILRFILVDRFADIRGESMEHMHQQALERLSHLPRHAVLRKLLESVGNYGSDLWRVLALLIA